MSGLLASGAGRNDSRFLMGCACVSFPGIRFVTVSYFPILLLVALPCTHVSFLPPTPARLMPSCPPVVHVDHTLMHV